MNQGQIVRRGPSAAQTYADHWSGLNDEQKLMLSMLGIGWIPNCSVFLGESRYDDIDPEIFVPLAHGPWKLGVYLPSMKANEDDLLSLLTRGWVVVELGEDCIARWGSQPHLFKNEFVFGSLNAQKAATRVRRHHWMNVLQNIS